MGITKACFNKLQVLSPNNYKFRNALSIFICDAKSLYLSRDFIPYTSQVTAWSICTSNVRKHPYFSWSQKSYHFCTAVSNFAVFITAYGKPQIVKTLLLVP